MFYLALFIIRLIKST